ncbi:hypothetical protein ACOME3_006622 [Neoechinorhynchus agilis]
MSQDINDFDFNYSHTIDPQQAQQLQHYYYYPLTGPVPTNHFTVNAEPNALSLNGQSNVYQQSPINTAVTSTATTTKIDNGNGFEEFGALPPQILAPQYALNPYTGGYEMTNHFHFSHPQNNFSNSTHHANFNTISSNQYCGSGGLVYSSLDDNVNRPSVNFGRQTNHQPNNPPPPMNDHLQCPWIPRPTLPNMQRK